MDQIVFKPCYFFYVPAKYTENTIGHLECLLKYIDSRKGQYLLDDILRDRYFRVDYNSLISDDDIASGWSDFEENLVDNTEYTLKCFGMAMHTFIYREKYNEEQEKDTPADVEVGIVHCRIMNFEPVLQLKDLKVNYYGKVLKDVL